MLVAAALLGSCMYTDFIAEKWATLKFCCRHSRCTCKTLQKKWAESSAEWNDPHSHCHSRKTVLHVLTHRVWGERIRQHCIHITWLVVFFSFSLQLWTIMRARGKSRCWLWTDFFCYRLPLKTFLFSEWVCFIHPNPVIFMDITMK